MATRLSIIRTSVTSYKRSFQTVPSGKSKPAVEQNRRNYGGYAGEEPHPSILLRILLPATTQSNRQILQPMRKEKFLARGSANRRNIRQRLCPLPVPGKTGATLLQRMRR